MRRPQTIGDVVEIFGLLLAATIIVGLVAGYQLVVLTTSSMTPAAPAGSLLIVSSRAPAEIKVDDMIVMRRNASTLVTHRVIELRTASQLRTPAGSPQIFATTKGDANETPDPDQYRLEDDQRVVRFVIPMAGWLVLPIIDRTLPILGLAAVTALALLAWWRRSGRSGRQESDREDPTAMRQSPEDASNREFPNHQYHSAGAEGQVNL
ncbi:MAG: signal peptidase I [Actinomycetota bacterium]